MTTAGKEFVISHVFKNVSSMKDESGHYSPIIKHFGVPWKIGVQRRADNFGLYLHCEPEKKDKEWTIEVWKEQEIRTVTGITNSIANEVIFKDTDIGSGRGWCRFVSWRDLMKNYVVDDSVNVQFRVKIKKMTGINLRNFDESNKEFSDVVLVVENKKFYVSKLFLASQSPFFKSTLLEVSESGKLSEHTLKDVKAADIQKFLELLHGENPIDDSTVAKIAHLANMFEATLAIQKCEQFLIENSKKSLKEKLQLAHQYKSEKLKNHCISKIYRVSQIRVLVDDNPNEMDPSVVIALLQKSLDLHKLYTPVIIACIFCTCLLLPLLYWKGLKDA